MFVLNGMLSYLMWVRGLKLNGNKLPLGVDSRTLCGYVEKYYIKRLVYANL